MWIIIGIIIIIGIVCYSLTSKAMDNTMNNFEEDKWWLVGMFADIYNKKRKKVRRKYVQKYKF